MKLRRPLEQRRSELHDLDWIDRIDYRELCRGICLSVRDRRVSNATKSWIVFLTEPVQRFAQSNDLGTRLLIGVDGGGDFARRLP